MHNRNEVKWTPFNSLINGNNLIKEILGISIPTTLARMIGSTVYFFEPIILTTFLLMNGYTNNFITYEYGILTGYVMPLLLMPSFFSMAISQATIPVISNGYVNNKIEYVKRVYIHSKQDKNDTYYKILDIFKMNRKENFGINSSDSILEEYKKQNPNNIQTIGRMKGLGECDSDELAYCLLDKKTRNVLQLKVTDRDKTDEMFNNLYGKAVGPRVTFLAEHLEEARVE